MKIPNVAVSILLSVFGGISVANAQELNIVEVAEDTDGLATLVTLVQAAGLAETLSTDGPFTLFAPTDEAFAELPTSLVTALQQPDYTAHLTNVLLSHTLEGEVPSSAITEPTNVTTLSGQIFPVTINPIAVNGEQVIDPDVLAYNGVIHVIDGVILPDWVNETLPEVVSDVASLSTLSSLLQTARLEEVLAGPGPFTVFAPTNEAIEAVDTKLLECIAGNAEWLNAVLTYHVVPDMVPSALLASGSVVTVQGEDVVIDTTTLTVNGDANIVGVDEVLASNGIGHAVDGVLFPPTLVGAITACAAGATTTDKPVSGGDQTIAPTTQSAPDGMENIAQIVAGTQDLFLLKRLVESAGLVEALSAEGPFTVFAPTSAAVGEIPAELNTMLQKPEYKAHLTNLLLSHVLEGRVASSDINGPMNATTLSGEVFQITVNPIAIDGEQVSTADVPASNGVVHIIDGVILPAWTEEILPEALLKEDNVSTLVSLLQTAGLVEALSEPGPFTVFAPTNDALAAVDPAILNCISGNAEWLSGVLTYHVVESMIPAAMLSNSTFATLQGDNLVVDFEESKINGETVVVGADAVLAKTGIAHLVSSVLVPPSLAADIVACANMSSVDPSQPTNETEPEPPLPQKNETTNEQSLHETLPEAVSGQSDSSTLVKLLNDADLVGTLSGQGPFTVFAPTDDAFSAVPNATLQCIIGNETILGSVLTYHVLKSDLSAEKVSELGSNGAVETVQGDMLDVDGVDLVLNKETKIIEADAVVAENGRAHTIDRVLVPPSLASHISDCVAALDTSEGGDESSTRSGTSAASNVNKSVKLAAALVTMIAASVPMI